MSEVINRKEKLSKEFNAAILNILEDRGDNMDNDFYKHLTFKTLVNLKKVLSNINNLITLQTSVAFVYFLCKRNKIRPKVASNVIKEINKTNAKTVFVIRLLNIAAFPAFPFGAGAFIFFSFFSFFSAFTTFFLPVFSAFPVFSFVCFTLAINSPS